MYKKLIAIVPLIFVISLISSCGSPREQLVQQQLFTFGTLVDISIWTDKTEQAQQVIATISADFEQQHQHWHPTNSNSLLAQLNQQLQQGEVAQLDDSLFSLVQIATIFSKQSEGLFNPAIGLLVDLWHFDQLQQVSLDETNSDTLKPPSKEQIQALVNLHASMTQLELNPSLKQLRSRNPAIKLDFGAFAKGFAVEHAINTLRKAGFNNALINAGGDIKAIGSKGDRAWKIGIRNPFYQQQTDQPVIASMALKDNQSIMTSGDYERFFSYKGKQYHHIIDPRNGYPANGFHSVTIVHNDASLADAAATAIFIAGPEQWKKIAQQMGINKVLLITQTSELIISQQLKPLVSLADNKKLKTTVVNLE
ncbi:MAG: FAD:protein FMN transferase [Pseudomonadota bacterium]